MSLVFSAFTAAYAIFEIPTGWWGDRIGTRRVLARIVVWWSAFTALTGAVWNLPSLLAARFLFGAGEAGAWPNVARTFSRWFPASERATAQGIFFTGAHLGGGVTPILVTALLLHFRWRTVFILFSATGLIWAAFWYRWFRDEPREHPQVNSAELEHIEAGRREKGEVGEHSIAATATKSASVWFLCLMYFTQTYGFTFFVTWLPTYLSHRQALSGWTLSLLSGAPLLLSAAGDTVGGLITDALTRRTNLRVGRCAVGGVSLLLAAGLVLAALVMNDAIAAGILIAFAAMFSNLLLGASWGACVDLGGRYAGTISATMNTAGQIGGVLSPIVYARLSGGHGSDLPLLVIACLYAAGGLCWWFIHPERPLFSEG